MFRLLVLSCLQLVTICLAARIPHRVPLLDGRIVGGKPTTIEEYPHQLSLLFYDEHICGASIISPIWALTAAHCTDQLPASSLKVRAGSSIKEEGGEVKAVSRIIEHEDFNRFNMDFDISLLRLASSLSLGRSISLAENEIDPGTLVTVTGWGDLSEGGSPPSQLHEVSLNMKTRDECTDIYGEDSFTDQMICAGGEEGKDTCQGDSGGPLITDEGKIQVGVVSWGLGCARPGYPGVYTYIKALRQWIKNKSGV